MYLTYETNLADVIYHMVLYVSIEIAVLPSHSGYNLHVAFR